MSRVQLIDVSKQFGGLTAVSNLNLDIQEGEFVSVVGGSGCGKTTTLRMIAGFEDPSQGEIRIGDRRMNGVPVQDRGVGIVFQSYALFPTMTVARNIGFGLEMAGQSREQRELRVREMLELVDLTPLAGRFPWQLSGGQQQRVALARALAIAPRVLLLDEPLSALDARIRLSLRTEIRRIQKELGITALYVTHDQEEALAIADRIVVMDKGVVKQADTARAIYDRPQNAFVAGFVGICNLFEARLESDGSLSWQTRRWRVLSTALKPGNKAGDAVTVALRPERLRLEAAGGASRRETGNGTEETGGLNRLEGILGVKTFLGAAWRVEVRCADKAVLVDVPREDDRLLAELDMGAPVVLSFRGEDVVLV